MNLRGESVDCVKGLYCLCRRV